MFVKESTHKNTPWRAKWIWLSEKEFPDAQKSESYTDMGGHGTRSCFALFRKSFTLKQACSARAFLSADCRYRMCINGEFIGDGPMEPGGDCCRNKPMGSRYYDCYEVMYTAGENTIEIWVSLHPELAWSDVSEGHGGLIFESETPEICICTDETWLGGVDARWSSSARYLASAGEPTLWPAEETQDIWGELLPRELPPLMYTDVAYEKVHNPFYPGRVEEKDGTITVSAGSPVTFWLDFGKIYSAYAEMEVETAGKVYLKLDMQELIGREHSPRLRFDAVFQDCKTKMRTLKFYGVQYIQITLDNLASPVTIAPKLVYRRYPVTQEGSFACSDAAWEKIYDLSKWTLEICRQSYHMDSPVHQEPLGDTGDYLVESMVGYACFGDAHLTRMDILRTARLLCVEDGKMFHTAYSLMWPQLICDYILHTGDSGILKHPDIVPALALLFKRFAGYVGEMGIVENAPNYMFVDWTEIDGFNMHHPPRVLGQGYMTANYYNALVRGGELYARMGMENEQADCLSKAAALKEAFAVLYDADKGLYFDGFGSEKSDFWMPAADGRYYTFYTNTAAILYDLCDKASGRRILRMLLEDKTQVLPQPFFMHFVFEALHKVDLFAEYGFKLLEKWKALAEECPGGLKEVWSGFDCDFCHAWGATPAYQMVSKVLGVTPTADGYKRIRIAPMLGDLSYAEGRIPTPLGEIYIRHENQGGKIYTQYTLPKGMEAESGDGK